jgi:uncharacterized protein YndB with AHSA1/START domain
MPDLRQTVDIAVPPEDVWAVLTDLDRLDEWVVEHRAFPDGVPAGLDEGTTYTQTLEAAGQDVDIEWTVVEYDEPRVLAFDGSGPAGSSATLRYELEAAGEGTRMLYATSFDLPGGPLGSIAAKAAAPDESDAEATLDRLRSLVER